MDFPLILKFFLEILNLILDLFQEQCGGSAVNSPVIIGKRQTDHRNKTKYSVTQVGRSVNNRIYTQNGHLRKINDGSKHFHTIISEVGNCE